MLKSGLWMIRLLPVVALAFCASPTLAQLKSLRTADDQFIQGLREQGMSDLLGHFEKVFPPEDPIALLALKVANNEFLADDQLRRASEANANGDVQQAIDLFNQSKAAFEQVLAAQRQLVTDHADDDRIPLWQTDYAEMLLDRYLPRYHRNVAWAYEFGQPLPEEAAAFESAMVEALVATQDAYRAFDMLMVRAGQDAKLRPKLEEMGVWYTLQDYRRLNGPYWFGMAAHGVSLLPDDHSYFKDKPLGNVQKADPAAEKERLRDRVLNAFAGALENDDRTKLTATMMPGRSYVWSSKVSNIDIGIEDHLEEVIKQSADSQQGYLSTLSKAAGLWNTKDANERKTALEILEGMDRHPYVRADGTVVSRLLAADLMFKLLNKQASEALPSKQPELIAKAYERAYVPLIENDEDTRFKNILFDRWASTVKDSDDPSKLPATVRMGIGERLTQQGGALAQQVAATPLPNIPAQLAQWKQQKEQAAQVLTRAKRFNETLTGEGLAEAVLGRGIYNLGMNLYWLAELEKAANSGQIGWEPYLEPAKLWISVATRAQSFAKAEEALQFGTGLVWGMDNQQNSQAVLNVDIREQYKKAFELFNLNWPQNPMCHDNRLYAAFHLYEKQGDLDKAVEVYRLLPPGHRDYFQAKRQMVYAMHRSYKRNANELRVHNAIKPPAAELNATQQQKDKLAKNLVEWETKRDALVETLDRQSEAIVEEAELLALDAEEGIGRGRDPGEKFAAATAKGAATVVLAGMDTDKGRTNAALEMLKGFEAQYEVNGPYAQLVALQAQPDGAKATLQGLIQSAQQQRILSLLEAGQIDEMAKQGKVMMDSTPDVAAAVVNGVLTQLRTDIEVQERVKREAPFEITKQRADEQIKFLANAAVALGDLLVQWAQAQGFDERKMVAYRMPLADSLMLGGRGSEALDIMLPIVKEIPNNFSISMKTGKAHLAVYKQTKNGQNYNGAMEQFTKVINYYNQRPEKPAFFWDAWLHIFRLLDAAGKPQSDVIPDRGRMLKGIDEGFGGPEFKDRFYEIINEYGGIEVVVPSTNP